MQATHLRKCPGRVRLKSPWHRLVTYSLGQPTFSPSLLTGAWFQWERIHLPVQGNAEDSVSAPGLGRSPGGGNGHPLQSPCLGNPWTNWPSGQSLGGTDSGRTERLTHRPGCWPPPGPRWGSQGAIPVGWFPTSFPALKTQKIGGTNELPKHIEWYRVGSLSLIHTIRESPGS